MRLPAYAAPPAWTGTRDIREQRHKCGYCGAEVGANVGYESTQSKHGIYICPLCKLPTYIGPSSRQTPRPLSGEQVLHLPEDIGSVYREARSCKAVGAYTASALVCRKLLMNVAINLGAKPGQRFVQYVEFFLEEHHVPPSSHEWVDAIRDKGNEATHEIPSISRDDASNLMAFVEMLLKLVYEFPQRVSGNGDG